MEQLTHQCLALVHRSTRWFHFRDAGPDFTGGIARALVAWKVPVLLASLLSRWGGGGGCGQGALNPIAKNCVKIVGKLLKIAEKIAMLYPKPQRATRLHKWLRKFRRLLKHGPQVSQLLQATLNITVELEHEPKAADIVIRFVLPLGNTAAP